MTWADYAGKAYDAVAGTWRWGLSPAKGESYFSRENIGYAAKQAALFQIPPVGYAYEGARRAYAGYKGASEFAGTGFPGAVFEFFKPSAINTPIEAAAPEIVEKVKDVTGDTTKNFFNFFGVGTPESSDAPKDKPSIPGVDTPPGAPGITYAPTTVVQEAPGSFAEGVGMGLSGAILPLGIAAIGAYIITKKD